MKMIKWVGNADVEGHDETLPNFVPGASVLITGSRLVAGTDQKNKRNQRLYECTEC